MLSTKLLGSALRCKQRLPAIFQGFSKSHGAVLVRPFHSTCQAPAKAFLDKENQYAHDILQQSLKPYQIFHLDALGGNGRPPGDSTALPPSVLHPPQSAADITGDELMQDFCALTRFCAANGVCISEERFAPFAALFCSASHKLSDVQLAEALRQVAPIQLQVESVKVANFVEIWNALDAECCHRIEGWSTDQLLLVCDAWYALNLARICDFVWEALRKLGRKIRKMRPEQLVQCMFLCNLVRRPVFEMFEFEVNLAKCAEAMTLKELSVMSMGFFKTQTPIRNPDLLEHIYRRLIAKVDTVEDITLVAILKVLRYSSKLPQADIMMELLDALCGQIDRLSLLSCLHVALLGSDLQCAHDEIVELILQRFSREIEQTRLKDLERICLVLGLFNHRSPSHIDEQLSKKILEVLRTRVDEIMKYPRCFPLCLHFLTLKGHYDAEMISSALDPQFIRHTFKKNPLLGREIFHLDSFVKINLRDAAYEGHQLTPKNRRTMGKVFTNYIPERNAKYKLNNTDRILVEMKECMERIFRSNLTFKHILPHFERPDVVICYDRKKRRTLPISSECPEDYSGVILTRAELLGADETPAIDTVAVVIAGWNNVIRMKDRHTGLFDMKLKQLQLLGHKSIVIYWHEWRELETQMDRQDFMKRRLSTVLNL